MRRIVPLVAVLTAGMSAGAADVQMETVAYAGWPNCIRLANGEVELVATTDVGPRIIRFGFIGGQNLFKEYPDQAGKTGGDEWRIYGGHRFWHAPEAKPRTYSPDNTPIGCDWKRPTLTLIQPVEKDNGIQKTIEVTLDTDRNHVRVVHRMVNRNPWSIELAPWSLTVMAANGRAIFPQEPYRAHTDYLLPARPLVLWHYTDMQDARWTWGRRYIQLRQDSTATTPQKAGFRNSLGWAAYALNGDLFVKRYRLDPEAVYPDFGCNTETFTNKDMLEVETLGPLTTLAADGGEVTHTEDWFLFKADIGRDEADIDAKIAPLVRSAEAVAAK